MAAALDSNQTLVLGWTQAKLPMQRSAVKNGRECRIRTYDPLLPKQVRYQTALIPDIWSPRQDSNLHFRSSYLGLRS